MFERKMNPEKVFSIPGKEEVFYGCVWLSAVTLNDCGLWDKAPVAN